MEKISENEFTWAGRKFKFEEDGSLSITLSRKDSLECARIMYDEFLYNENTDEDSSFAKWLKEELKKEGNEQES